VTDGGNTDWKKFLGLEGTTTELSVSRQVVKRDGTVVPYEAARISDAIVGAFEATQETVDQDLVKKLTEEVEIKLQDFLSGRHPNSVPAVEEIQDIVESVLIENRQVSAAKAFILYRARHEAIRDTQKLMLDFNETMNGYLSQSDWRVNENANVNFSLGGLILHNSVYVQRLLCRLVYPAVNQRRAGWGI